MSSPANWFVYLALQSTKLCTFDASTLAFVLQFIIWIVDSVAVTYIVQFIENKNALFWLWFTTNALQTLTYEPLIQRSLHFHVENQKDIVRRYFIATVCYYVLHVFHIIFMFVVIFVSYASPPAELNIAIAFTWIGSALSCITMGVKQQLLNSKLMENHSQTI